MIESCEKKSVADDFSNTTIVHVRNSKILQRELGYDLVTHASQIPSVIKNRYDHIICHYASPYMKYKEYLVLLESNPDAKLHWFMNDHDGEDNILLRNYLKQTHKAYNVICNNPRAGYRHWILGKNLEEKKLNDWLTEWHTLNLNTLIFSGTSSCAPRQKSGCIYFGTFRKHRAEDMAAFNGIENYTISSSTKNQQKYIDAGIQAKFIDKLDWTVGNETLANFKYSIYFEDKHTHENFAYLANRFYECLMTDVVLFFDRKCQNTIDRAREQGYIIDEYLIVDGADEINRKIRQLDALPESYEIALNQQRLNIDIAKKEKQDTLKMMREILS